MSWLDQIRSAPHEKKVRLIWICIAVAVILLVIAWILSSQLQGDHSARINVFKNFGENIRSAKSNLKNPFK
jgi:hypothetical protein